MSSVVVIGSSNTDYTLRVPTLPVPGETRLGGVFAIGRGGKGANQAVASRRAGAEVVFVTAVGDDDAGRAALEALRSEGIDVGHAVVIAGATSGSALILVDDAGENLIGVAPGANAALRAEHVDALPDAVFKPGGVLLASLEIPLEAVARALRRARAAGMRTVLNPAPATSAATPLLALADVVAPNRGEAATLAGMPPDSDPADLAAALIKLGARDVVITLGSRGCLVATPDRDSRLDCAAIPSPRVVAVDTVGAGDAFNGALATALAERRTPRAAAAWAVKAGALAVTVRGAQTGLPYRDAIDALPDAVV
ncbi:MAG: ribokinase [Planctomycetota bacterium]|nr:ribokinase [Planctomycetota bacterium]